MLPEAHPAELKMRLLPNHRNISFRPGECYCILKVLFLHFFLEGNTTGSGAFRGYF